MKFRKKPVEIDAVQFVGGEESATAALQFMASLGANATWHINRDALSIWTLEGTMTASVGDWIIRGVQGEYYPCKPDIFADSYEPVDTP